MAIERPAILTCITIPTGGKVLKIWGNNTGPADDFLVTIPAGDYFISWDGQSDDLLWKISNLATAGFVAEHAAYASTICRLFLDSSHKVNFRLTGSPNTMRVDWTANDGPYIGALLGFDTSAVDTCANNATLTADYHHGYGWYADEDGYLADKSLHDSTYIDSPQVITLAGNVRTVQWADLRYSSSMSLFAMTQAKTWSGGISYGTAPSYPYNRNEALECWYREAIKGTRFRVYRNSTTDSTRMLSIASGESATAASSVDLNTVSWTTNQWAGYHALITDASDSVACRWNIASNDANTLTASQAWDVDMNSTSGVWYLSDGKYSTYVLDTESAKIYAPSEHRGLNRFSYNFKMWKYVS